MSVERVFGRRPARPPPFFLTAGAVAASAEGNPTVQPLNEFRKLLQAVRNGCSSSAPHLAEVGNRLRYLTHGTFRPEEFGAATLAELVRLVPEIGNLARDHRGQPIFQFDAQEHAAEVPRIDRDFWGAVTSFHPPPGGYKFDLQSQSVVTPVTPPEGTLASEPERFLSLPDAGVAFQLELARRFLTQHGASESETNQILAERSWLAATERWSVDHGTSWGEFRREAITHLVLDWADRHGIPRERVVSHRPDPRSRRARQVPARSRPDLRAWLHRVIDRMTDSELLALALPVRVLMETESEAQEPHEPPAAVDHGD